MNVKLCAWILYDRMRSRLRKFEKKNSIFLAMNKRNIKKIYLKNVFSYFLVRFQVLFGSKVQFRFGVKKKRKKCRLKKKFNRVKFGSVCLFMFGIDIDRIIFVACQFGVARPSWPHNTNLKQQEKWKKYSW